MKTIEGIFDQICKECGTSKKFQNIKSQCESAKETLSSEKIMNMEVSMLRDKVLEPLQLALESGNNKLATVAVSGIQCILHDERFHSNMESELEEQWLPMQILNTVWTCPSLPEEVQVEVMKVLLDMIFSTGWCMNAVIIVRISQLCVEMYLQNSKLSLASAAISTLNHVVDAFTDKRVTLPESLTNNGKVCLDVFSSSCGHQSVKMATRATLNQMLKAIVEKYKEIEESEMSTTMTDTDMLTEFGSRSTLDTPEELQRDVLDIFQHFCEKLSSPQTLQQNAAAVPLYLEAIATMVASAPVSLGRHPEFTAAVWQCLCPTLVSLLTDPKGERGMAHHQTKSLSQDGELGRGSGVSANAPGVSEDAARAIYKIAVHLVGLVGHQRSMKPVLESLFHRILLYPPPQHRMSALKVMKELWSSGQNLLRLAWPTQEDKCAPTENAQSLTASNIRLLKIMVDSLQECCHCGENALIIQSVECVDSLLRSIDQLTRGEHITPSLAELIESQFSPADLDREARLVSRSTAPSRTSETLSSANSECGEVSTVTSAGDDRVTCSSEDATTTAELPPILSNPLATNEAVERQCARDYILSLLQLLPKLLFETSSPEGIDEALLNFASNFCTELQAKEPAAAVGEDNKPVPVAILNADAVYVTTWVALQMNLQLVRNGYYECPDPSLVPMSLKNFMDRIFGGGLLLFLSESWLAEVYSLILDSNYLQLAGYRDAISPSSPFARPPLLIEMLLDMDGLDPGQHKLGQFLLRHRIAEAASEMVESAADGNLPEAENDSRRLADPCVRAGRLFAKCVLVVCWEGLLDILATLLTPEGRAGGQAFTSQLALLLGTEGAREECRRAREAVIQSLEGLQDAARLASLLDLQARCGTVFAQLAAASCQQQLTSGSDFSAGGSSGSGGGSNSGSSAMSSSSTSGKAAPGGPTANKPLRMHASHALSLDVVLTRSLEMGSQAPDCWRHVFRCCSKVASLERAQFCAAGNTSTGGLVALRPGSAAKAPPIPAIGSGGDLDDFYGVHSVPSIAPHAVMPVDLHIPSIIAQSRRESAWDSARSVLTVAQTCRVLCALSSSVDSLFEQAAEKLTLRALVHFMRELCKASDEQLRTRGKSHASSGAAGISGAGVEGSGGTPLLLDRLSEVLLRCISSDRPTFHILKLWSAISPHLTEACCHADLTVARRAVSCLHEGITRMLSVRRAERPHFHVHEFLCKPVETLLCLELCASGDIQDQLVCSICELVEACSAEIQSGWRPLFGALRAVKLEFTANEALNEQRQRHINAVLDVFEVFLNTDNVPVFANAAVDCILCLLKYVKGSGEFLRRDPDDPSDDEEDIHDIEDFWLRKQSFRLSLNAVHPSGTGEDSEGNLCLPALQYLQRCCEILANMWEMPSCPKFKGAERIMLNTVPRCVLPINPEVDMPTFLAKFPGHDLRLPVAMVTNLTRPVPSQTDRRQSSPTAVSKYSLPSLDQLDKRTGLLHVWFLLLDGLSSAVWACPKPYQPAALDTLFCLLRSTVQCPGPGFALYITNRLLLPLIQSWLRQPATTCSAGSRPETNLRQACGLATDLVVDFLQQFAASGAEDPDVAAGLECMLDQLMLVLVECIAQPNETVSRLGSSCIKHLLTSAGTSLTPALWRIACDGLQRAFHVSFYPLALLLTLFQADSEQFYGDSGKVKVAARKDMTVLECERLRQLAHKVFLMEGQEGTDEKDAVDYTQDEMRNYVFLLYPKDESVEATIENTTARVQFRSVVYGMLSQQRLLETLKELLLSSCPSDSPSSTAGRHLGLGVGSSNHNEPIVLSSEVTQRLMLSLCDVYNLCYEFDRRPGLKFLLQKVAHARVAVNLYKQSGVCITLLLHTLLDICRRCNIEMAALRDQLSDNNLFDIHEKLAFDPSSLTDEEAVAVKEATAEADGDAAVIEALRLPSEDWKLYTRFLAHTCAALVHTYLAMLSDRVRLEVADRLCAKPLFFLVAQPDEMPEMRLATLLSRRWRSGDQAGAASGEPGPSTQSVCGVEGLEVQQASGGANGSLETNGANAGITQLTACTAVPSQGGGLSETEVEVSEEPGTTTPNQQSPKRAGRHSAQDNSRVYTMASEGTIRNLMAEYKRRKLRHSLPPPRASGTQRSSQHGPPGVPETNPQVPPTATNSGSAEDLADRVVKQEQERSILKDSEARLRSWAEMISSALELSLGLKSDVEFRLLLPVLAPSIRLLVAHAEDHRLKLLLGDWFLRVANIFAFLPPAATVL